MALLSSTPVRHVCIKRNAKTSPAGLRYGRRNNRAQLHSCDVSGACRPKIIKIRENETKPCLYAGHNIRFQMEASRTLTSRDLHTCTAASLKLAPGKLLTGTNATAAHRLLDGEFKQLLNTYLSLA